MNRADIKTVITNLCRGYIAEFGIPNLPKDLAGAYWDVRLDTEIDRDQVAGVTLEDYEIWVMSAVADHQTGRTLDVFKSLSTYFQP